MFEHSDSWNQQFNHSTTKLPCSYKEWWQSLQFWLMLGWKELYLGDKKHRSKLCHSFHLTDPIENSFQPQTWAHIYHEQQQGRTVGTPQLFPWQTAPDRHEVQCHDLYHELQECNQLGMKNSQCHCQYWGTTNLAPVKRNSNTFSVVVYSEMLPELKSVPMYM